MAKFNIDANIEEKNLFITVQNADIPKIIKELAIADVEIIAVIPQEHSLEEIFFDATEGGKIDE